MDTANDQGTEDVPDSKAPAWAPTPWEQLTVLQVGDDTAAAFTGRLFVELGCRVILVERPGERAEHEMDSPESGAEVGLSSTFTYLNWAKQGVTIDYVREEGVALLARLAKHADVIIRPPFPPAMGGAPFPVSGAPFPSDGAPFPSAGGPFPVGVVVPPPPPPAWATGS